MTKRKPVFTFCELKQSKFLKHFRFVLLQTKFTDVLKNLESTSINDLKTVQREFNTAIDQVAFCEVIRLMAFQIWFSRLSASTVLQLINFHIFQ